MMSDPRTLAAAAAAAALLVVACNGQAQQQRQQQVAQAPQAGAAALREIEEPEIVVQALGLTVEDIEEDADLYDRTGEEEVGEIDSVLTDAAGRPVAISADVGSYLNADEEEKTVVIGLDRLRADEDGDLVTTLTKEELLRLPAWDDE